MVRAWGAPARSTTLSDGRQAHTWVDQYDSARTTVTPMVGIFGGRGNVGVGVGMGTSFPMSTDTRRCERTLIFSEGQLVEQSWNGPDEYCGRFRRG